MIGPLAAVLVASFVLRIAVAREETRRLRAGAGELPPLIGTLALGEVSTCAASMTLVFLGHALGGLAGATVALLLVPALFVAGDLLPRARRDARRGQVTISSIVTVCGRMLSSLAPAPVRNQPDAWTRVGMMDLVRPPSDEDSASERRMVGRVFEFAQTTVAEIMVPLVNVSAVRDDAPLDEVIRVAQRDGYSRVPVFHLRMHNIIGIVHAFDLLSPAEAHTAGEIMQRATYVWEMTPAAELLRRLQVEGVNLAVAVDEYGGAVGIITVEDILEEVVGEIQDEHDTDENPIRAIDDRGEHVIEAAAEIDWLNERFPWQLPEGPYETIGGLLLDRLGHIPVPGESVHTSRVRIRVTKASLRGVDEVSVSSLQTAPAADPPAARPGTPT